jgi:hydroxymethylpyrimidine synthase
MSAAEDRIHERAEQLSAECRQPFTASRKIYVEGPHGLRVPMREIELSPTRAADGLQPNAPVTVYDTSGPYTDPQTEIDLRAGLAPLRAAWIEARGDTEQLTAPSSIFGRIRAADGKTRHLRFEHVRTPRKAKAGANLSQMHYARRGIVTPEMEYIAIRENGVCPSCAELRAGRLSAPDAPWPELRRHAAGGGDAGVRARRSRPRPRHHPGQHQPSPNSSR